MTMEMRDVPSVAPQLVTDQVYGYLEAAILNGDITGGTRLRVRQVAEMVGTSVMPVREAISRLEDSGLAEREAHKGAVVKKFSIDDLIKIYSVRLILEPEAARAGTEHMSDDSLARMSGHLENFRQEYAEGRIHEALQADTAFLRTLYESSGNDVLSGLIDTLWKRSHLYRLTVLHDDTLVKAHHVYDCNLGILESARRRDSTNAESWVRKSIQKSLRALTQHAVTNRP